MTIADRVHIVKAAKAQPPATVIVQWSDGVKAAIDLTKIIQSENFRSLRKLSAFSSVRVGEWGHSIEWPSGPELSAETLWLETLSVTGAQRAFVVASRSGAGAIAPNGGLLFEW